MLNFHYLVATKHGVEHLEEAHELTLYTKEETLECFTEAGLEVSYDENLFGSRFVYCPHAVRLDAMFSNSKNTNSR